MATITTSVSSLIRQFNLSNTRVVVKNDNQYAGRIPAATPRDQKLYESILGTPVITDLTIKGGTYTDENGRLVTFQDIILVTVLITVSQSKRIIITDIQGRDGSVKEYIGMDDYQVTINGILTGGNGRYPIEDVSILKEICKAPISLQVISRHLQNLDIFNIVIKDFVFDQEPGGYSQQVFSLFCLSDIPVELLINAAP